MLKKFSNGSRDSENAKSHLPPPLKTRRCRLETRHSASMLSMRMYSLTFRVHVMLP